MGFTVTAITGPSDSGSDQPSGARKLCCPPTVPVTVLRERGQRSPTHSAGPWVLQPPREPTRVPGCSLDAERKGGLQSSASVSSHAAWNTVRLQRAPSERAREASSVDLGADSARGGVGPTVVVAALVRPRNVCAASLSRTAGQGRGLPSDRALLGTATHSVPTAEHPGLPAPRRAAHAPRWPLEKPASHTQRCHLLVTHMAPSSARGPLGSPPRWSRVRASQGAPRSAPCASCCYSWRVASLLFPLFPVGLVHLCWFPACEPWRKGTWGTRAWSSQAGVNGETGGDPGTSSAASLEPRSKDGQGNLASWGGPGRGCRLCPCPSPQRKDQAVVSACCTEQASGPGPLPEGVVFSIGAAAPCPVHQKSRSTSGS